MSANKEYVTKEYLEQFMGAALEANNDMQKVQLQSQFASFMSAIETKLGPLVEQVNQLTNIINAAQQQTPPAAPPIRQKFDMAELVNVIKEGASAYKDVKSAAYGETTELDKWGMAAAEVAKREAINAMKLQVRRGLRSRVVSPEAVENIVGETIEAATGGANHKPIL